MRQEWEENHKKMNRVSPNFIHSLDAVHMQLTILSLKEKGIADIWAVHDCFGTHACHIEDLRTVVKETFVKMHGKNLDDFLREMQEGVSEIIEDFSFLKSQVETKNSDNYFEINDVLESEYLIS